MKNSTPIADANPPIRRRRWVVWLLVLAFVSVAVALFHPHLLRGAATVLIVDEPPPSRYTLIVLHGDHSVAAAAARFKEGAVERVVFVTWKPGRLQEIGAVPPSGPGVRRALVQAGVPRESVEEFSSQPGGIWEFADQLSSYLERHHGRKVVMCVPRFNSRQIKSVMNVALGDSANRATVWALADPSFEEGNWWRSKPGLLTFQNAWTRLAFHWCNGRPNTRAAAWDSDAYERGLP